MGDGEGGSDTASDAAGTAGGPGTARVNLGRLALQVLTWGPEDGPLALCLHGFPDTAHTWRHLGPALAARGYRVVAPFTRGYAPSDLAPDGTYQTGALVADAIALRRALGDERPALLVGHDWGALTAYGAGVHAPELWSHVVGMAVPPAPAITAALRRHPLLVARQARASWYTVANQVPGLAERALPRLVRRLWADWSPGYDATVDLAHVDAAMDSPARRTAVLRYYRAWLQPWRRRSAYGAEERAVLGLPPLPLLYLHGAQDGCVLPAAADVAARVLPGARVLTVPASGHFLQLEQPARVRDAVLSFLDAPPGP